MSDATVDASGAHASSRSRPTWSSRGRSPSEAGRILLERYERLEPIDYKSARDVVTEVDHLSEALILDAIRARFPGDAILAEETGEHQAGAGEDAPTLARGRTWIVDPLDGTVNYANGIPFFCVSIGLVVDGVPAVGVIHDPMRGRDVRRDRGRPGVLSTTLARSRSAPRTRTS